MAQDLRGRVEEEDEEGAGKEEREEDLNSERHRGWNATLVKVGGNKANQSIRGN